MTEASDVKVGRESVDSAENAIVLARDPFASRSSIPFRDAQCTRLLAQLNQLIDKTELLALVSGPPGSGKSVLARMFVEQAPAHFVVLSVDASSGLRSVDLLSDVVERFGNRRRKNEDVHDLFTAHYSRGKQPVLVIDAAEHLEERALQLAGKLAEHGLHLVLVARAEREPYLAEKLDADRIQVLRIAAYDRRRTYCYLQHCLASAGYQGPMPFDAPALDDISANGGGTPAGINHLAHQYLVGQPPHSPASSPRKVPKIDRRGSAKPLGRGAGPKVVAAGVLLALVLGVLAVLLLTGRLGGGQDAEVPVLPDAGGESSASMAPEVMGAEAMDSPPAIDSTPEPSLVAPSQEPEVVTREPEPVKPVSEPSPPKVETQRADEDVVEVPEAIERMELDEVSATSGDVEMASLAETPDVAAVETAPTKAAETPVETRPDAGTPEPEPDAPVSGPLQPDNDAIRARNPRHYTMQLVSGPSLKAVQRFADRHGVAAESVIYQFERDGTAHYALVYRNYESREEALAALDALPKKLKARKPWLRRLSAIQRTVGED